MHLDNLCSESRKGNVLMDTTLDHPNYFVMSPMYQKERTLVEEAIAKLNELQIHIVAGKRRALQANNIIFTSDIEIDIKDTVHNGVKTTKHAFRLYSTISNTRFINMVRVKATPRKLGQLQTFVDRFKDDGSLEFHLVYGETYDLSFTLLEHTHEEEAIITCNKILQKLRVLPENIGILQLRFPHGYLIGDCSVVKTGGILYMIILELHGVRKTKASLFDLRPHKKNALPLQVVYSGEGRIIFKAPPGEYELILTLLSEYEK
jgi:hypothetical protein